MAFSRRTRAAPVRKSRPMGFRKIRRSARPVSRTRSRIVRRAPYRR